MAPKSSRGNPIAVANKQEFVTGQELLVQAKGAAQLRLAKERGYQINASHEVADLKAGSQGVSFAKDSAFYAN